MSATIRTLSDAQQFGRLSEEAPRLRGDRDTDILPKKSKAICCLGRITPESRGWRRPHCPLVRQTNAAASVGKNTQCRCFPWWWNLRLGKHMQPCGVTTPASSFPSRGGCNPSPLVPGSLGTGAEHNAPPALAEKPPECPLLGSPRASLRQAENPVAARKTPSRMSAAGWKQGKKRADRVTDYLTTAPRGPDTQDATDLVLTPVSQADCGDRT